ncbi:SH3 domain-containing protein [Methylobacterium sp. sgz302541]|uniref:SH3 domain-containing protein n=1 Tax=unclassified Methylobacterium TaxID=2615210 RepID=UPI003D345AC8
MPRSPLTTVGAACLTVALSILPAAAADTFRVDGLPYGDSLTIRETPDASAAAVGQIPVGRRVLGFGCTNDTPSATTWCRVRFGRALGWARRRYLAPE